MLRQPLHNIKEFILSNNTYFNNGYDAVFQDATTGVINDNKQPIFPNDNLGNYFYLRLPQSVSFIENAYNRVTELDRAVALNMRIILVACMRGADPDILISNLVNTLQQFDETYIKIDSFLMQSSDVVLQEMAKVTPKSNTIAALARLDEDYTIVSVQFTLTQRFQFQKLSCITNPCKTC
jgi:hypothetical protein